MSLSGRRGVASRLDGARSAAETRVVLGLSRARRLPIFRAGALGCPSVGTGRSGAVPQAGWGGADSVSGL